MKRYPLNEEREFLDEIQPYFGRDGYYLAYDVCWFEFNNRAYFVPSDDFKYSLMLLNTPLYRECEYDAMRILIKAHIASRKMRREVREHDLDVSSQKMLQGMRLRRNKVLKKHGVKK